MRPKTALVTIILFLPLSNVNKSEVKAKENGINSIAKKIVEEVPSVMTPRDPENES
jgi:hypothetical protein